MSFEAVCRICGKSCISYPCNSCGYNGDGYEQPIIKEKPTYEQLEAKLRMATEKIKFLNLCIDQDKDLEAKNRELVKELELYTDKIFELEKKLEIVKEALEKTVKKDRENGFWNQSEASKSLAAIKGEGV